MPGVNVLDAKIRNGEFKPIGSPTPSLTVLRVLVDTR
jgi:hypothetical protein